MTDHRNFDGSEDRIPPAVPSASAGPEPSQVHSPRGRSAATAGRATGALGPPPPPVSPQCSPPPDERGGASAAPCRTEDAAQTPLGQGAGGKPVDRPATGRRRHRRRSRVVRHVAAPRGGAEGLHRSAGSRPWHQLAARGFGQPSGPVRRATERPGHRRRHRQRPHRHHPADPSAGAGVQHACRRRCRSRATHTCRSPGNGKDKINAAFAIGGAPLLTQTVEQATGLRLDHYAEVGFGGFAGLVDALGGVSLCLPESISDPLAGIDLPAGCQELDGRNALGYVRSRATPRADLDRMVNQRQFVSALLQRAASPAVWLNPLALVFGAARGCRRPDRQPG